MTLNDRGKIKWKSAFFMPEHVRMLKDMERDFLRNKKPILDHYEIEEIENTIHEAMEYAKPIMVTVWHDGFTNKYKGLIHRLDSIQKTIYVAVEEGGLARIHFADITELIFYDPNH